MQLACNTIDVQCNTCIFRLTSGFALRHLVLIGSALQGGKKVNPGLTCTFQYRFTAYYKIHRLHNNVSQYDSQTC